MIELKLDASFLNTDLGSGEDFELPIPASTVVKYFQPFIRNHVKYPIPLPKPQLPFVVKYNYELWKKELLTEFKTEHPESESFETQKNVRTLIGRFRSHFPDLIIGKSELDEALFGKLFLFTALAENLNRGLTQSSRKAWRKDLQLYKKEVEQLREALLPFLGDQSNTHGLIKESNKIVGDELPVSALRFSLFSQKDTKIESHIFRLQFYQFLRSIVTSVDTSNENWVSDYMYQENSKGLAEEDLKQTRNSLPQGRPDSTGPIREFCYCLNQYLNSNEAQAQFWSFTRKRGEKINNTNTNNFIYSFLESAGLVKKGGRSDFKLIEQYIKKYKDQHSL